MIRAFPFEPEELVIVEIGADGYADTSLVHRPAVHANRDGFGSRFDSYEYPPARWPAACGRPRSGSVYARAGVLEGASVCLACEEAA